jgi:membrane protease YdiL (CAAX protease family)
MLHLESMTTPHSSHAPHDDFADKLRGFGPIGILSIIIVLAGNFLFTPLSALLVIAWAWRSNTPWKEIGYVAPKSWIKTIVVGIVFGIVFKLFMKSIGMPLLGGPAINPTYHYLLHNASALPGMVYSMIIVAGFGEETLFRGYLFERLGKLFGKGILSTIFIILTTTALFASEHYPDQGLPGVEQAVVSGLVLGSIYSIRKEIFTVMIIHAVFDLTAVALIYYGLEYRVAHWFF